MAREPKWITRAREALDAMERNPPSTKNLAPWRTKNWIAKGQGWLLLKPIAVLALVALVAGCLGRGNAVNLHELRVLDELRQINFTLEQGRDTRHPVQIHRPDIWNRMFARPPDRPDGN